MKAFKGLGSVVQDDGHAGAEINRRIQIGRQNWKKTDWYNLR